MLAKTLLPKTRVVTSATSYSLALPRLRHASTAIRPSIAASLAGSRPTQPLRRWYSEQPEAKKEEAKSDGNGAAPAPEEALKKELETKDKEIVGLKDKYMRSVADFRNLQERTKREVQAARDFALQRFSKDLIESIDNLDRALHTIASEKLNTPAVAKFSAEEIAKFAENTHQDLQTLHSGLKMTETVLMQTLEKHGLVRFDPSELGERFDPNKHEATFQAPQPDKEDGSVFHTQQKGYLLNGRILRAAKVGVVKNS
ncbi:GrpE-domain-containing protein [Eremomyces bilateralis CBS 781.70]|uniref:GrpE protein homolog n=1 Tax=Eremomyces bilateralis CBS 781.70 TaxID=1392243 RepID=A0A6G1FZV1_9PEZI|nr:GrpE-domain-containing protein [Eremomyces bilateralis CBS 781.70]KAF1811206.1 GrpE-domain-containing protein [Eremomyces bilateralis CBS 781.70]